jgi:hypothetical protein
MRNPWIHQERVLNPDLFCALRYRFGHVKVSHLGVPMLANVVNTITDGPKFIIVEWGEMYRVNCPFCGDTGFSLAVSYRFGTRDGAGRRMTYAAFCNRGKCLARYENRTELYEMLSTTAGALEEARIRPGLVPSNVPVPLPRWSTPLDRLPEHHHARRYLERLGLDPDLVGRDFNVAYSDYAEEPCACNRLIIPVSSRCAIQGWQALAIEGDVRAEAEVVPTPKFWVAPRMSATEHVYNLGLAGEYHTGVVVSTPIDVWRFGPMAVSPLGDVWSEFQCRLIAMAFLGRSVVLLADAAKLERRDTQAMIDGLAKRMAGSFAVATLPENQQGKAFDQRLVRALVVAAAAKEGVHVLLEKTTSTDRRRGGN